MATRGDRLAREAKLDEQGCSQCGSPYCRWAFKLAGTRQAIKRDDDNAQKEFTEADALAALSLEDDDLIPF